MSIIINPNAVITLAAAYPSNPQQCASLSLPYDPSVQGMPPFSTELVQAVAWIYMRQILECRARIDRLERLVAYLAPETLHGLGGMALPETQEVYELGAAMKQEVAARRAAEAKARAERDAAGGVQ